MGGDGGFDTAGRGGFAVSGRLSQPRQPRLFPLHPLLDKTGLTVTGLSRRVACNGSRVREADTLMPCGGLTVWAARRRRNPQHPRPRRTNHLQHRHPHHLCGDGNRYPRSHCPHPHRNTVHLRNPLSHSLHRREDQDVPARSHRRRNPRHPRRHLRSLGR